MSKLEDLHEDNVLLFKNIVTEKTSIPDWINIELLANNKQKEIYRISKTNDVYEKLTDGVNFVVILNEEIFDQLTDCQKEMILIECLNGVLYDSEKDSLSLTKPDFISYRGVLEKFGHEEIIVLKESIKSLYDKKKEEDDKNKN